VKDTPIIKSEGKFDPNSEQLQFARVELLTKDLKQRRHLSVSRKLHICDAIKKVLKKEVDKGKEVQKAFKSKTHLHFKCHFHRRYNLQSQKRKIT